MALINNYYFQSKDVRVFPSSFRGTYDTSNIVFDPEARLNTEANFVAPKQTMGKDTYIIEYNSTNNFIKFILGGYYFELTNVSTYLNEIKDKYIGIKLRYFNLKTTQTTDPDTDRTTALLDCWESNQDFILDRAETNQAGNTGKYYFTGLKVLTSEDDDADFEIKLFNYDSTSNTISVNKKYFLPNLTHGLGNNTLLHGLNLEANSNYQTVIGKYNDNQVNSLFEIGNGAGGTGTEINRSNALEVLTNKTNIYTDTEVKSQTQSSSTTTGSLIIKGGVGIAKNVYVGNNLNVAQNITVGGDTDITGNTEISGTLEVTDDVELGNTTINGTFEATGNAELGGTLEVTSTLDVGGKLTVASGGIEVTTGGLTISGGADISGDSEVSGDLEVTGDISAADITASGDVEIGNDLEVDGGITSGDGEIYFISQANKLSYSTSSSRFEMNQPLYVNGNVYATDFQATGNTSISGNTAITGNTSISGNATISGDTTITGDVGANKVTATDIETSGETKTNTFTATGDSKVEGTSTISKKLTVESEGAEITGASSIDGNLDITNGELTVAKKLTVESEGAEITGSVTVSSSLQVGDTTTNTTINNNSISTSSVLNCSVLNTGSSSGKNKITYTNNKWAASNGDCSIDIIDSSGETKLNKLTLSGSADTLLEIKSSSNTKFKVEKTGNVTATGQITANSFDAQSDRRLKENIIPFISEKSILDLPVYKYDYIEGTKNNIGCIAQDLQEICPELVSENFEGYLSIKESKLVYLLLEEIKKLNARISKLEKE